MVWMGRWYVSPPFSLSPPVRFLSLWQRTDDVIKGEVKIPKWLLVDNQIQIGGALVSLQLEYRNLEGKISLLSPASLNLTGSSNWVRKREQVCISYVDYERWSTSVRCNEGRGERGMGRSKFFSFLFSPPLSAEADRGVRGGLDIWFDELFGEWIDQSWDA